MSFYELTAGTTASIDIDLLSQGSSPSGTMVGMTVALILKDRATGITPTLTSNLTIPDTAAWSVRLAADATDLVPGVFNMRIKVTDSGGKVQYFPSGEWDTLRVWDEV